MKNHLGLTFFAFILTIFMPIVAYALSGTDSSTVEPKMIGVHHDILDSRPSSERIPVKDKLIRDLDPGKGIAPIIDTLTRLESNQIDAKRTDVEKLNNYIERAIEGTTIVTETSCENGWCVTLLIGGKDDLLTLQNIGDNAPLLSFEPGSSQEIHTSLHDHVSRLVMVNY